MNGLQRLIGLIGAVMLLVAAVYPRWDVVGRVQYDYKQVLDDSGRETFSSMVLDFHNQSRGCLFADRGEPMVRYNPPVERIFQEKQGYSTKSCVGTTLVDYQWHVNIKQMLVEMLAFLVPTLLLILVFKSKQED